MKKLLAVVALVVAAVAVPSSAQAEWGATPSSAFRPPASNCSSVEVVRVVKGKRVSSKVITTCSFVTDPRVGTQRIDWD